MPPTIHREGAEPRPWRTHLRRWVASIPDELPWALAILTAAAAAGYVLGYRDGAQAR